MNPRLLTTAVLTALALTAQSAAAQQATPSPSAAPQQQHTDHGKHLGQIKKLASGALSISQVRYALTHKSQVLNRLKGISQVRFEDLRVYRLSSSQRSALHLQASSSAIAFQEFRLADALAQTTSSNPLLDILANINVSDALNNALNGNDVSVSLSDVLNSNNIGIGQVVGVYIGGGSIITTII